MLDPILLYLQGLEVLSVAKKTKVVIDIKRCFHMYYNEFSACSHGPVKISDTLFINEIFLYPLAFDKNKMSRFH
jgi:hypothetical protein